MYRTLWNFEFLIDLAIFKAASGWAWKFVALTVKAITSTTCSYLASGVSQAYSSTPGNITFDSFSIILIFVKQVLLFL